MKNSYKELLKEPIKNAEILDRLDRAIKMTCIPVGNYAPSTPYVVRVPKRIPRKLKKKFGKTGYQYITPETLKLLYNI